MRPYLDSSALVKLVQVESESRALRRYLRHHMTDRPFSSVIAQVEVVRAVSPAGEQARVRARRLLRRIDLVGLAPDVLDGAAGILPGSPLRSLDAIHLASAMQAGSELEVVVTYDQRMSQAAVALAIPVAAPH